jgi:hypothetical protein
MYHTDIKLVRCIDSDKSCMPGRAIEKVKRLTIVDDRMEKAEPLHVARQPTCEDHDMIIEKSHPKVQTSKNKTKSNENQTDSGFERETVRFGDRRYLPPWMIPSIDMGWINSSRNWRIVSGKKVTALEDKGCETELIISRRFAQRHGIAAAGTARSRSEYLCLMTQYL